MRRVQICGYSGPKLQCHFNNAQIAVIYFVAFNYLPDYLKKTNKQNAYLKFKYIDICELVPFGGATLVHSVVPDSRVVTYGIRHRPREIILKPN
jgi:hypothetical protein